MLMMCISDALRFLVGSWYPQLALVWSRRGVQRDGHRPAWAKLGRPLQLLQSQVLGQDGADAR